MGLFSGRSIRRRGDDDFEVRLDAWERNLLRSLPGQLRDLLSTDDPALERLFPPAYVADPDKEDEYRRLMRSDLTDHRLATLSVLEATVDATTLREDELVAWMGALNDLRLVLGTRLDISEEMYEEAVASDDPRAPMLALYGFLTELQGEAIEALSWSL
jgi:hypothetical protein